jgi:hypothetical protein
MTRFDEDHFRTTIASIKRPASFDAGHADRLQRRQAVKTRRAAGKLLQPVLAKAGLDIDKLNKLLAQEASDHRALFAQARSEAAKHSAAAEAAYQEGIARMRQAQALLALPFTSSFVTLDRPVLILQQPKFEINNFIDNHVEPFNSSIQYKVGTNSGSDNTWFNFYFIWQNPSDYTTVINVTSQFVFNGACGIAVAPGIFSGDTTDASIRASLSPMRWSGWGNDPATGRSLDQTYIQGMGTDAFKEVLRLHAHGGHIFGSPAYASKMFANEAVPLSFNLIPVPAGAVIMVQMMLNFAYGFDDGGNISDDVTFDFAGDGRSIRCPMVQLEVLTPLVQTGMLHAAPPLVHEATPTS